MWSSVSGMSTRPLTSLGALRRLPTATLSTVHSSMPPLRSASSSSSLGLCSGRLFRRSFSSVFAQRAAKPLLRQQLTRLSNHTTKTRAIAHPCTRQCRWNTTTPVEKLRNVAIIAHVDHGKTTLVDCMLRESGAVKEGGNERVMDSNDLEQERGITIMSKTTSIQWKGHKINLVDTPGHGDFGGEVERVLSMVDGVVLLVDALEGPMAQTKFVVTKALNRGLPAILLINKMDRDGARSDEVESEVFDLFASLDAAEHQMDYPTLYSSAREGWVVDERSKASNSAVGVDALFNAILKHIPQPKADPNGAPAMLLTTLERDPFFGRILTGRVSSGTLSTGSPMHALDADGNVVDEGNIIKLFQRTGMERSVVESAGAGDIVSVAGFSKATVSNTLADPSVTKALEASPVDPPVVSMTFSVNDSPLQGQSGKYLTSTSIRDRLATEVEGNVALQMTMVDETVEVNGRGELQLGILVENMRREGFELSISPPRVVFQKCPETGGILEPVEEVTVDVDDEYSGLVIDLFSTRKADMLDMKQVSGKTRLSFLCPSRSMIGMRNPFNTMTSGTGVLNHLFHSYVPHKGNLGMNPKGAMIASATGKVTSYALGSLEARGQLFVSPGANVYEGMVIGEASRDADLYVNPVRSKQLTNMRASGKDETIRLTPPRVMTLEECISYMREDELVEVTPDGIRLRKRIRGEDQRRRAMRSKQKIG